MKKTFLTLVTLIAVCLAIAQNPNCNAPTAQAVLDINNVNTTILNDGRLWWDGTSSAKYEIPKGGGKHVMFSGGIWLGALDDAGEIKLAAMTYAQSGNDFWSGPIENGTTDLDNCNDFNYISNIKKTDIYNFLTNGTITTSLENYIAKNNPNLPNGNTLPVDEDYFPFTDINNDGIYNINDGDYPKINSDQNLTWLMNDIGNLHTETQGASLGVEIKCTAYAFATSDILNNTTFYRYTITNKSSNNYNDFIFANFIDADIGGFQDDYVGCDSVNNFAYAYNGDDFDGGTDGFGDDIPIVAVVLLYAPYEISNNESKLGSFVYYSNDFTTTGNPENPNHYYNYLSATWKNGQAITEGEDGSNSNNAATNFMFPSMPSDISSDAWSECSENNTPGDRRMLLNSKPVDLAVGESITFDFAVVTSFDVSYPCPDITNLQNEVAFVQNYFDTNILDTMTIVVDTMTNINNLNNISFEIAPNPITDFIKIKSEEQFVKAQIFDLQGKQILSQLQIENNFIDLAQLRFSSGNYLLKLFNNENKIVVKKIAIK